MNTLLKNANVAQSVLSQLSSQLHDEPDTSSALGLEDQNSLGNKLGLIKKRGIVRSATKPPTTAQVGRSLRHSLSDISDGDGDVSHEFEGEDVPYDDDAL